MKALLDLINTKEDALCAIAVCAKNNATINHRATDRELNKQVIREGGFRTNFGQYGRFVRIGLGESFKNRWMISGFEEPRGKPFTGLSVYFAGDRWERPVEEQAALVLRAGGMVTAHPDQADIVVMGGTKAATLTLHDAVLAVSEEAFQRALPRVRSVKLSGDLQALWKLLSARDHLSIKQGISLAASLEDGFDDLLEGVEVDLETGEVVRNKRFTGTGPAQAFLDVAMYSLLSVVPDGSRSATLRAAVRKIDITIAAVPDLTGYDALDELRLMLTDSFNSSSLDGLGRLPALRALTVRSEKEYYGSQVLESLTGLDAPALESLIVYNVGLKDVDALSRCASLKSVDLSENPLDSIEGLATSSASLIELSLEGCHKLTSLDPLTGAIALRCVKLRNSGIKSLQPLSGCSQIDRLDVMGCDNLVSLKGLACQPLVEFNSEEFSLSGCSSMKSLSGLPRLSSTFQTLSLWYMKKLADLSGVEAVPNITILEASDARVTDLRPLLSLKKLGSVELRSFTQLADASPLGDLRNLKSLRLKDCSNLRILPDSWPSSLRELTLDGCKELASLGFLPHGLKNFASSFRKYRSRLDLSGFSKLRSLVPLASTYLAASTKTVDLSGCMSLETLAGLESMTALKGLILPITITDASAILQRGGLDITVDSGSVATIPDAFGLALAELPKFTLSVEETDKLVDCSSFGSLKAVTSIDLSACPKIEDLTWITGLAELKRLKISPDSPAGKKAKVVNLDNKTKVRQLQMTICAENKLPLPPHLSKVNKKRKSPDLAGETVEV